MLLDIHETTKYDNHFRPFGDMAGNTRAGRLKMIALSCLLKKMLLTLL